MKKLHQQSQFAEAFPLIVARRLWQQKKIQQDEQVIYQTLWLHGNVSPDPQKEILKKFHEKKFITVNFDEEDYPSEGGSSYPISVHDSLYKYLVMESSYDDQVARGEMSADKMAEWLFAFLEEKQLRMGKNEIVIYDEEINVDAVNPFLSALYLEMKNSIEIMQIAPPRKIIDVKEVILDIHFLGSAHQIRTSRFTYDKITGDIVLPSGKKNRFGIGEQLDLLLRAIHEAPQGFLTHDQIKRTVDSGSSDTAQEFSKKLIGELRSRLGLRANDEHDIIRTIRNKGYGFME